MRDGLSEPRLALLHPQVRDAFRKFIDDCENGLNITLRIVQGLRTIAEQNELFSHGRTQQQLADAGVFNQIAQPNLPVITQAKGGLSYHNYGLASDVVPMANGQPQWKFDFHTLLPFMLESMTSGLTFPHTDSDHFEITFGYTVQQLLAKVNSGDMANGYVNL